jgi:hypothetical protein
MITSQIFKTKVPIDLLFELLDNICVKNNKYYILDMDSYKKGIYEKTIDIFLDKIKDYYHSSKKKKYFEEKKVCFNNFVTIVRQILKINNIGFSKQIKYVKSEYHIVYFIYFYTQENDEQTNC